MILLNWLSELDGEIDVTYKPPTTFSVICLGTLNGVGSCVSHILCLIFLQIKPFNLDRELEIISVHILCP